MLFNSGAFAVFLPIVFFLYWILPHRYRWVCLLLTGYYYYMSWNPKYVFLIIATTLISYFAALLIEKQSDEGKKKNLLRVFLIIIIGTLLFFKYFNFLTDSFVSACRAIALPVSDIALKIILPVGISFYTFQMTAYVIDVYRGKIQAEQHLGIYSAFIAFFPQLLSGPIGRADVLLPQFRSERNFDYDAAAYGLKLMAWGFFKKIAIADFLGTFVDLAYGSISACTGLDLILAVFFYSLQIYCDFSGYTDIAIGTARLFGIELMTNFKSPYFSTSIKEFWSRWHISLSTWFRDYVYIPLGGNRCSKNRRDRNLMITFLLSGLWHGANWTFVIWGGLHGLAQIVENRTGIRTKGCSKAASFAKWMAVFIFCSLAWVFFRAPSIKDALLIISSIFTGAGNHGMLSSNVISMRTADVMWAAGTIAILGLYDLVSLKKDVIEWVSSRPVIVRWAVYLILIWLILFSLPREGASEFVYFQF